MTPRVGDQVMFAEDEEHTTSLGVISRVWDNGKYVTVVSDGHMFVRLIERVRPCTPCTPCDDPRFDHKRTRPIQALGVIARVPVCECGADIADHEELADV